MSRGRKDCYRERDALPTTTLEPGTLYVVRRSDASAFASAMGGSGACVVKGPAWICGP